MADVLVDSLCNCILDVGFRRMGEGEEAGACAVMERLLKGQAHQSLSSLIVTADRGYGRDSFLNYLRGKGIISIFVMSDHLARLHPFLPAPFLRVDPSEEIDSFLNADDDEYQDDGEDTANVYDDMDDDYVNFIIPEGGSEGPASFTAVRKDSTRAPSRLQATPIRIKSGDRISKVIRFYHDQPARLSTTLGVWIATPK